VTNEIAAAIITTTKSPKLQDRITDGFGRNIADANAA
jgi:hypothetical protein